MTVSKTLAAVQRKINLREEQQAKARADDAWRAAAQLETATLEATRGVELVQPTQQTGQPRKPLRRKSGLQWLFDKGRLGESEIALARLDAGNKYGGCYRAANDAPIASCVADMEGGARGTAPKDAAPLKVAAAQARLVQARIIALRGHEGMTKVCNAILGEEKTPLEYAPVRADADRAEATLLIALDLLADYFETGRK